jgi:hypothetical protein
MRRHYRSLLRRRLVHGLFLAALAFIFINLPWRQHAWPRGTMGSVLSRGLPVAVKFGPSDDPIEAGSTRFRLAGDYSLHSPRFKASQPRTGVGN